MKTPRHLALATLTCVALVLLALPGLADSPASPDTVVQHVVQPEVTLDQIFTADAPMAAAEATAQTAAAAAATEALGEQEPLFRAGENCGGTICGKGTYCCNASCGWCRPCGVSCIQIACN